MGGTLQLRNHLSLHSKTAYPGPCPSSNYSSTGLIKMRIRKPFAGMLSLPSRHDAKHTRIAAKGPPHAHEREVLRYLQQLQTSTNVSFVLNPDSHNLQSPLQASYSSQRPPVSPHQTIPFQRTSNPTKSYISSHFSCSPSLSTGY